MRLISNWRMAWRLFTVQLGLIGVAWVALPSEAQAAILKACGLTEAQLPAVLGVLVIVARVIAQPRVSGGHAN